MTSRPEPVLLILADISGYTRFMTANAKSLAHAQAIITELVTAIIREVELPLTVAKLEGDAVFLYARKEDAVRSWPDTRKMIGDRLLRFFRAFEDKLQELRGITTCNCQSCRSLERLKLKLIVHGGEALFHHVFGSVDLAGVDVIIAHRLLKNTVSTSQYILMTEAAVKDVEFPCVIPFKSGLERIDDIGEVRTRVYQPHQVNGCEMTGEESEGKTSCRRSLGKSSRWFLRLWFQPFRVSKANESGDFNHLRATLPTADRALYKVFILLASPLFVPVGLLFSVLRMTARHGKRNLQSRGARLRSEAVIRGPAGL